MSQTLQTLKTTKHGTYRATLVEMGQELPIHVSEALAAGEEPMVPVRLYMPLSDARRFGAMMFEWMELKVSTASLVGTAEEDGDG